MRAASVVKQKFNGTIEVTLVADASPFAKNYELRGFVQKARQHTGGTDGGEDEPLVPCSGGQCKDGVCRGVPGAMMASHRQHNFNSVSGVANLQHPSLWSLQIGNCSRTNVHDRASDHPT